MKKFLLIFIIMFIGTGALAVDRYALGVQEYKKGDFENAAINFEYVIKNNSKNVNARYYLAQVYLRQNRISDAKNQYNRIIFLAPESMAAKLSQKGLSLIVQSENGVQVASSYAADFNFSDNYLLYVLPDENKILKWSKFPINVFIEQKSQKELAIQAFKQWQTLSKDLVSFKFVNSKAQAQIVVVFKDKLESTSVKDSYIAGYSKPYYKNGAFSKSEIFILVIDPSTGAPLPNDFILFSTLHEIGHSLGFKGHSNSDEDVMAPSSASPKTQLTKRDINTLKAFYTITDEQLAARKSTGADVRLQQAMEYVKRTPDKSVGWANLGDIYVSKKMYSQAIQSYRHAISLEPDSAELYNLLGAVYEKSNDTKNALVNFEKASLLDKDNSFYLYKYAKYCQKIGKTAKAKSLVSEYLKNHPEEAGDERFKNFK
ncbi:MAG: tetratricopeptide repeat protein [bacterium]|nr:tetratricopeptide repeat protein [bacterium]